MDSYPNLHQKSHSIHIQVIFQEITALCLYMYIFLSCRSFITLFCNYPNCASVYNNYKNFNKMWQQIGQVNFILYFLSPALSQSQSYKFLLYPFSSLFNVHVLLSCLYDHLNFHLMTSVIILWSEKIPTSLNIPIAGLFDVLKLMFFFSFKLNQTIFENLLFLRMYFFKKIFKMRQNIWLGNKTRTTWF